MCSIEYFVTILLVGVPEKTGGATIIRLSSRHNKLPFWVLFGLVAKIRIISHTSKHQEII